MPKEVWNHGRTLSSTVAAFCVLTLAAMLSTPAQAQTVCNSTLIIGFPNGDNLNRVVGQTVRMSLTVTNGPSQDGGFPDNQVFTLIDYFPACTSVSGGVCTPDPGSVAGAPPAISYAGNLATVDCPSLPVADTSDQFDIQFSFAPALDFGDGVGCTFTFDVLVAETGSNGTPANVAQLARTDGICDSTLTSEAQGTAAITLTCPTTSAPERVVAVRTTPSTVAGTTRPVPPVSRTTSSSATTGSPPTLPTAVISRFPKA